MTPIQYNPIYQTNWLAEKYGVYGYDDEIYGNGIYIIATIIQNRILEIKSNSKTLEYYFDENRNVVYDLDFKGIGQYINAEWLKDAKFRIIMNVQSIDLEYSMITHTGQLCFNIDKSCVSFATISINMYQYINKADMANALKRDLLHEFKHIYTAFKEHYKTMSAYDDIFYCKEHLKEIQTKSSFENISIFKNPSLIAAPIIASKRIKYEIIEAELIRCMYYIKPTEQYSYIETINAELHNSDIKHINITQNNVLSICKYSNTLYLYYLIREFLKILKDNMPEEYRNKFNNKHIEKLSTIYHKNLKDVNNFIDYALIGVQHVINKACQIYFDIVQNKVKVK